MHPSDILRVTTNKHISKHLPTQLFLRFFGFHTPFLRATSFNPTCTTRHGSSLAALDCALNALLFEHITKGTVRSGPNGNSTCAQPVI
jgi:hypothetical protein